MDLKFICKLFYIDNNELINEYEKFNIKFNNKVTEYNYIEGKIIKFNSRYYYNKIEEDFLLNLNMNRNYIIQKLNNNKYILKDKEISKIVLYNDTNIKIKNKYDFIYSIKNAELKSVIIIDGVNTRLLYSKLINKFGYVCNIRYYHGAVYFDFAFIKNKIYFIKRRNNNQWYFKDIFIYNYRLYIS